MITVYLNMLHEQHNYINIIVLMIVTAYAYHITHMSLTEMLKGISLSKPYTVIDKTKCILTVLFINIVRLISAFVTVGGLMSLYAIYNDIPKHRFFIYYIFNFIPTIALFLHNNINNIFSIFKILKTEEK